PPRPATPAAATSRPALPRAAPLLHLSIAISLLPPYSTPTSTPSRLNHGGQHGDVSVHGWRRWTRSKLVDDGAQVAQVNHVHFPLLNIRYAKLKEAARGSIGGQVQQQRSAVVGGRPATFAKE
uniref:Uncharacterized protein n=1 Tax=Triticum urartu TaxID=4572 RepID=A0A8R7VFL7_TRIUA